MISANQKKIRNRDTLYPTKALNVTLLIYMSSTSLAICFSYHCFQQ